MKAKNLKYVGTSTKWTKICKEKIDKNNRKIDEKSRKKSEICEKILGKNNKKMTKNRQKQAEIKKNIYHNLTKYNFKKKLPASFLVY